MMQYLVLFSGLLSLTTIAVSQKIVLTNDDGWAVAQIRAQDNALNAAGYNVILSAPAEDQSGTGSSSAPATVLTEPCEFNSCPTGSPAEGFNASNTRLNYVNSFPVDAVRFGIQTLSPKFFDSSPDFVVSGPNVGTNLGSGITGSGTVGAACEAALEGLASTAFSGSSTRQESYTDLTSDAHSASIKAALINADLTTIFLQALLASSARPVLPAGVTLNVNFSPTAGCSDASDYEWILTRVTSDQSAVDVQTCGTDHLPTETSVITAGVLGNCFASVSVINATTKTDVDAATQGAVLDRLSGFLSCFNS